MPYAYVHEFETGADRSTTNYDALRSHLRLAEAPAAGLILHAAGFTDGTFQMLEIWETPEHAERFERERLVPALQAVVHESAAAPTTRSFALHNLVAPMLDEVVR